MMAGYDDNGPQLYQIDPSGSYFAWKASAIGKNMTNAKAFLEKRYSEEVRSCSYACFHSLSQSSGAGAEAKSARGLAQSVPR
jgi:20S proteasome alpha/beta subunit